MQEFLTPEIIAYATAFCASLVLNAFLAEGYNRFTGRNRIDLSTQESREISSLPYLLITFLSAGATIAVVDSLTPQPLGDNILFVCGASGAVAANARILLSHTRRQN